MEAIRIQKIDGQEFVPLTDYLRLKEENKVIGILNDEIRRINKNLREENQKLKEENKKLKEEVVENSKLYWNLMDEKERYSRELGMMTWKNNLNIGKIKELEEENQKLKEERDELKKTKEAYKETITALQECITDLREIIANG